MFIVNGGRQLNGELRISGAKNAVLPLMAAAMLTSDEVIIHNCPKISDVFDMRDILISLGAEVSWVDHTLVISAKMLSSEMPEELSHKIRSSIFLLGSILSRCKRACFFMPGGCEIGARPIDQHLFALELLGAKISLCEGKLCCETKGFCGAEVLFDFPSVGATENAILAGVMAEGVTILRNSSCEPEIVCLANMLNEMGARIYGAGSGVIYIKGVKSLHGTEFTCIPDRIEFGTYLAAVSAVRGEVLFKDVIGEHLRTPLNILENIGSEIHWTKDGLLLRSVKKPKSFRFVTAPYPGFPTDLQPQFSTLACFCKGSSVIRETVFENRLGHFAQLAKAGAKAAIHGDTVQILGMGMLKNTDYQARDLRGGAAFLIAALATEGQCRINNTHFIDRGYEAPEEKLRLLGADIIRI